MMLDMPDTTTKLIDFSAVLRARMPSLKHYPAVLVRFFIWCLRTLVNEDRINQFLQKHGYLKGSDFIDQVFDESSQPRFDPTPSIQGGSYSPDDLLHASRCH